MFEPRKHKASTEEPAGPDEKAESGLPRVILPTAGTMVGVVTTLIGLVKVAESSIGPSRVDRYLSLVLFPFLFSGISAYFAIRYRRRATSKRFELAADVFFFVGVLGVVAIAAFFAYELI